MVASSKKIALITGANKGIGFEISRQLAELGIKVVMGSRHKGRGEKAVRKLMDGGLDLELVEIDVNDGASIDRAVTEIVENHKRVDILVNNAGIMIDWEDTASSLSIDNLRQTMETNFYGALGTTLAVLPYMKRSGYGRIVNMSSTIGSLAYICGGGGSSSPAYRLSKVALNGITAVFAAELGAGDIKINSVSPGWVRTDMGGESAPRSVKEGADTAVWLATIPEAGPNGGFFRDRKRIDW